MLEEPKLIKEEPVKVLIRSKNQSMRGLCQSCYSSNEEISLCEGQAKCNNCKNGTPKKQTDESKLIEIFKKIPNLERGN